MKIKPVVRWEIKNGRTCKVATSSTGTTMTLREVNPDWVVEMPEFIVHEKNCEKKQLESVCVVKPKKKNLLVRIIEYLAKL